MFREIMGLLLGYDIGSSSVKASLLDAETGLCLARSQSPLEEMPILAPRPGWAEQDPGTWWLNLVRATRQLNIGEFRAEGQVLGIGISYQMHGLICLDKFQRVLRPAIIWCDSRAVGIGEQAFRDLGPEYCLGHLLNAPGNFTASRLAWVREYEPEIFDQVDRILLPGDYIALRLTGSLHTTIPGLSEGIFWDFMARQPSGELLDYFQIPPSMLPTLVPTFGIQGLLSREAAGELELEPGIPLGYRAGDQPNNAWSLQVLDPGELAATAGTSAVIYGIHDQPRYDPLSRVNTFVHVNDAPGQVRCGVLLCVNGSGSLYRWLRQNTGGLSYEEMNRLAASAAPGSGGLKVFPFGNGSERVLENRRPGARFWGLDFNRHGPAHLFRAAQEGIVFALRYGLEIMEGMGLGARSVRAGYTNLFLSPLFREIFSQTTGTCLQFFETDGSQGAARAAGVGMGHYRDFRESFLGLEPLGVTNPSRELQEQYEILYLEWKSALENLLRRDPDPFLSGTPLP